MKRRSKAKEQVNYSAEFFDALKLLEQEKGIPADHLLEKIRAAIIIAVKRDHGGTDENISVILDPDTGKFSVSLTKTVAEEITDENLEMTKEQAAKYNPAALPGDVVQIPLETHEFGRIAAQTAKHVIRQGIREAERGQQLQEFQRHSQDLVTAIINRIDPVSGNATLEIGKNHAVLPASEQTPGEELKEGQRIKVYVAGVQEGERGPRVLISRKHRDLVKRLFELEVPEIFNGVVEIKAVSREAGSRTKMAVLSHDENVDAVGACIGPRGARVAGIVEELGGEKIDIVEYNDDPAVFIAAALAPAKVVEVVLDPDGAKSCHVTVPDNQLSLAIGNKGQNARLAVHLTGWKIDIRPESGRVEE
ncbi:MAG: transcription termination/antitermination protein NusA [Clostridia bacterium]|nr:transcription termination/antitermination protein NusA [Clostridia bacterium]MBQ2939019.1 transcription termination/antitermination protein NusA [Clostridia bacterium]